jgi:hypothetical protein
MPTETNPMVALTNNPAGTHSLKTMSPMLLQYSDEYRVKLIFVWLGIQGCSEVY